MQTIYQSTPEGQFNQVDSIRDGAWISLVEPAPSEISEISTQCGVDPDDLRAALDVEERSRVTAEEGYVLVLVDVPTTEQRGGGRSSYITIPLGIIITQRVIITVCLERVGVLADFEAGRVRDLRTFQKTRFTLQMLLRNAASYLSSLRDISKMIDKQESALRRSTRNEELTEMLELEKSLVYISTSLVSNQRVLQRLVRTPEVKKYPDDDDLLQDAIVENEQAMEMASIYSGILSGTMDAYASVIANNQNAIMKMLALITIVLSIPTMIFSMYGMNTNTNGMPFLHDVWGFGLIVVVSFCLSGAALIIFIRKRWF